MFKLIVVSAALIATAAVAQTPPAAESNSQQPTEDPNEVVCRSQPVIGSLVNRIRVCRTRAEWANARTVNEKARRRRTAED